MNCKVIIEQQGKGVTHKEYEFDDFRVATAIANLLDNIRDVKVAARCYNPNNEKAFKYVDTDSAKENTDND